MISHQIVCFTPSFAAPLKPWAHRPIVASISLKSSQLDISVTLCRCYKDVYVNSFFPRTARLWNFLPEECFLLTYDLNGFKCRVNRHIFS